MIENKDSKLEYYDKLIAIYSAFKEQIYNPKSVLYPSCGFDASPTKVFDNVTFVDIEKGNEGCIEELKEAGFYALKQDIKTYTPKQLHDLVILLNPAIHSEWALQYLRSSGYILSNNYHGNAAWLNNHPKEFNLIGVADCVDGKAIIEKNKDHNLEKTVTLDSIKESRALEHLMFTHHLRDGYDVGLPFARQADLYIFQRR